MAGQRLITPAEVLTAVDALIDQYGINGHTRLWGVPRGGIPVALAICAKTGATPATAPVHADVLIDDTYDSGATCERYLQQYPTKTFAVAFDKRQERWRGQWLVFPWEMGQDAQDSAVQDQSGHDIVVRLLQFIGENPAREGLQDTPKRVTQAWREWSSGYNEDPASILKTFTDGATDEMVIVHGIPVVSKCEHHLSDIIGIAHVGYIPNGKIVGLSKLARLVEVFARRLIVQERMTSQIADALMEHVEPLGVGVYVRANHHCMSTRGVRIHGSETTTSAMRGVLLTKPEARAEFLKLVELANGS